MGHHVDMAEVMAFHDRLKMASDQAASRLKKVKSAVHTIEAMNTFKGQAADKAKEYFGDFHLTVLDAFKTLFDLLNFRVKEQLKTFSRDVDGNHLAIIKADVLAAARDNIDIFHNHFKSINSDVSETIHGIRDILDLRPIDTGYFTDSKNGVIHAIEMVERDFDAFIHHSKHADNADHLIEELEKMIGYVSKIDGQERYQAYKIHHAMDKLKDVVAATAKFLSDEVSPVIKGTTSSLAVAKAARNKGFSVTKAVENGRVVYRIEATEEALKELGIKLDKKTLKDLKNNRYKNTLSVYESQSGKEVRSKVGKQVFKEYPELAYYYDSRQGLREVKFVGKAFVKGAVDGVIDTVKGLNVKDILRNGTIRSGSKVLAPAGAAVNYYMDYQEAKEDGLKGNKAVLRASFDATIDTAVSSGIQAGLMAAGTLIFPGVGTAVGAVIGFLANWSLNHKFGKKHESVMDRTKGVLHKLIPWFH